MGKHESKRSVTTLLLATIVKKKKPIAVNVDLQTIGQSHTFLFGHVISQQWNIHN